MMFFHFRKFTCVVCCLLRFDLKSDWLEHISYNLDVCDFLILVVM